MPKRAKKTGFKFQLILFLVFIAVLIISLNYFYSKDSTKKDTEENLPQDSQNLVEAEVTGYSEEFYALNIPEYKSGVIVQTHINLPSDSVMPDITIITNDPVSDIAEFYENELSALGWKGPQEIMLEDNFQEVIYSKNGTDLKLQFSHYDTGDTAIFITYR